MRIEHEQQPMTK